MQYLSKAYNYYSGINPATLSGAIDVIVVRHVDEDGEVTLASSPFHVRFGKLQVLRAGEKRVTLRLPNNLPAPCIAPFSMKVGETGEAFFVLETDEEIPEELLTSPVIMPSDTDHPVPAQLPNEQSRMLDAKQGGEQAQEISHASLTHQPFGETEQQVEQGTQELGRLSLVHQQEEEEPLGDVEYLDLNASTGHGGSETPGTLAERASTSGSEKSISLKPSSLLNSASSLLPSIPFLSSTTNDSTHSAPFIRASREKQPSTSPVEKTQSLSLSKTFATPPSDEPENTTASPVKAPEGRISDLSVRDATMLDFAQREQLNQYDHQKSSLLDGLPHVKRGEGDGLHVKYGKDVVLDMAGYHSGPRFTDTKSGIPIAASALSDDQRSHSAFAAPQSDHGATSSLADPLIDAFTSDLMASVRTLHRVSSSGDARPIMPVSRSTDPELRSSATTEAIDNYDAVGANPPEAVEALPLDPDIASTSTPSRRRLERGISEPPQVLPSRSTPVPPMQTLRQSSKGVEKAVNGTLFPSPDLGKTATNSAVMDYAWDWGRLPSSIESKRAERGSIEMDCRASGPSISPAGDVEELLRRDSLPLLQDTLAVDSSSGSRGGKLKNVEENPYLFVLDMEGSRSHTFELSLCGADGFAPDGEVDMQGATAFLGHRISFQKFIESPEYVDDPRLVLRYSLMYLTWATGYRLMYALAMYRRSLTPPGTLPLEEGLPGLADMGVDLTNPVRPSSGYGWSRWWRRGQSAAVTTEPPPPREPTVALGDVAGLDIARPASRPTKSPSTEITQQSQVKQYAKTLRLSSDQLKELNLKPGPNTIQFSVSSSYSGMAICEARIFLWEQSDQIVISDIDGTVTKSDALGHVFAAIGRDWTHPGIAKLYTDVCNNGYKMLYLTSRAIGQADSTREYLRSIVQGEYRLPEGPVIMSPDRLMASLHREVIMRKPELFKMACLRDIQRLFEEQAKEAFFAGFGNRITDAMSYRSIGIPASKIYTIDPTGVVKTELLQSAGHKGSYVALNDLVNELFPPASTKFKPEYTDFNYWRVIVPDIPLPDFTPPSPTLSVRSDSSRMSSGVLSKLASIGRRSSRQPLLPSTYEPSSRPSSPLMGPAMTADDLSDDEENGVSSERSRESSMPGSFEERIDYFPDQLTGRQRLSDGYRDMEEGQNQEGEDISNLARTDSFDDDAIFDDDILAAGEMKNVPF